MLPGPDLLLACPLCGGHARRRSLASGNTFGGTLWSDLTARYPMLPPPLLVSSCPHCRRLFWIGDAEELGWEDGGEGPSLLQVLFADDPEELDLIGPITIDSSIPCLRDEAGAEVFEQALLEGVGSTHERKLQLHLQWWWARNDPYRGRPEAPPMPDAHAARSLRRIEALSEDALVRAVACLAVGAVEDAQRHLSGADASLSPRAVRRLRALVAAGDRRVVAIDGDGA